MTVFATVGCYLLYINTRVTKHSTSQSICLQNTCPTAALVKAEHFSFIFNIYDVLKCSRSLPCDERCVLHVQRNVGVHIRPTALYIALSLFVFQLGILRVAFGSLKIEVVLFQHQVVIIGCYRNTYKQILPDCGM